MNSIKPKKCAVPTCRREFIPHSTTAKVCSMACAIVFAGQKREKSERKSYLEQKARLKTRQDHVREAQVTFNAFIRYRDKDRPCISCGRHHTGQIHAGHYRTTKAAPALRFNEDNCHAQCAPCNTMLSGNILEYRIRLIRKIGQARVDFLEGPHEPAKWSVDQLKEIRAQYKQKLKELKCQLSP